MYINLPSSKQKCSCCGSVDCTERVETGTFPNITTYLRCTICGHKKMIWTQKTSEIGDFTQYNTIPPPDTEEY
jgi:hypothetical protein